jgi:hypothetical protein
MKKSPYNIEISQLKDFFNVEISQLTNVEISQLIILYGEAKSEKIG